MGVRTTAGTTLEIAAGSPATFDISGYDSLFDSESPGGFIVGEITDLGEFGREYALVTHNPIGTRGTQKFKGSFNEGTMTMQLGLDERDDGQIVLKAAALSDDAHSFRVTLQSGDVYYFRAMVMSYRIGAGTVDSVTSASVTLELTTSKQGVGVVADLVEAESEAP